MTAPAILAWHHPRHQACPTCGSAAGRMIGGSGRRRNRRCCVCGTRWRSIATSAEILPAGATRSLIVDADALSA